jgi:long-chain fatty acid transport protein
MAQLGTVGPTSGMPLGDFGGTTSSVHSFGGGFSVGTTYDLNEALRVGAAYKSKVRYKFEDIIHTTVNDVGFQTLKIEEPEEIVLGASSGRPDSRWLFEADAVWKGWSNAKAYKDAWKDQWLFALGAQHSMGPWKLRAGYHYSTDIMKGNPNNTIGGLVGLGTIPLGKAADAAGLGAVAQDIVKIVQTTLLPVVMKHTLSAGVGYQFDRSMRLDVYGAYAFRESVERRDEVAAAALGAPVTSFTGKAQIWTIGAGLNFSF